MLSSKRLRMRPAHVLGRVAHVSVAAMAVMAAGCSSDVTRFGFGGLGGSTTTSSIPIPPEPVGNGYAQAGHPRAMSVSEAPLPPAPEAGGNYRVASRDYGAPPPAPAAYSEAPKVASARQPSSYQPTYENPPGDPPGNYRVVGRQYKTPPPAPIAEAPPRVTAVPERSFEPPPSGAQSIEVQPGETLYSIGRRYGVTIEAIKRANGLSSNIVRPGERLVLPSTAHGRESLAALPPPRGGMPAANYSQGPAHEAAAPQAAREPALEASTGWTERHTVRNGESLYGIANRYNVSVEELKRANGISDPTRVWAGTVLNVPGQSRAAAEAVSEPQAAPQRGDTRDNDFGKQPPPRLVQSPPRVINAAPQEEPERRIASRGDIANDASPSGAADMTAGKFRWPVRGKVIAGFGRRPDGTHNDGVNVAVAHGTEIQAAETGKVVYAGNQLKGYGNLVLIRHPNGYVTAYAHADRLLVNANDEVRRGQAIATAGRTGAVDQPQLHFELRQGSKPIDPLPHLTN